MEQRSEQPEPIAVPGEDPIEFEDSALPRVIHLPSANFDSLEDRFSDLSVPVPDDFLGIEDGKLPLSLRSDEVREISRLSAISDDILDEVQEILPAGVHVISGISHHDGRLKILIDGLDYSREELNREALRVKEQLGVPGVIFVTDETYTDLQNEALEQTLPKVRPETPGVAIRRVLPESLVISRTRLQRDAEREPESVRVIYRRPGIPREVEQSYEREIEWSTGLRSELDLNADDWLRTQIEDLTPDSFGIRQIQLSTVGRRTDNRFVAIPTIFVPELELVKVKAWREQLENTLGIQVEPIIRPVSQSYYGFVKKVGDVKTGSLTRPELIHELLDDHREVHFEPVQHSVKRNGKTRVNLTKQATFAVDPSDLDRDDAYSIHRVPGGIQLQVHITDVPALIRLGSKQLYEGLQKGYTVYGKEWLDPLHPRRLALEVGSLKQDRDRLARTFIYTLRNGTIEQEAPFRSTIRVGHALTYDDLYDALSGKDHQLHESATLLAEFHEAVQDQFEEGTSSEGRAASRDWSHALIAKNNILVNRTVAEFMATEHPGVPFLFRAFQAPREGDAAIAQQALTDHGFGFLPDDVDQYRLQRALRNIELMRGPDKFSPEIARLIGEAYYTTDPEKHAFFDGLYAHLSSPLRRGSDVVNGFQVSHALDGTRPMDSTFIESYGRYLSWQTFLMGQRHREHLNKEHLLRHEELIGQNLAGTLTHVSKQSALVEVEGIGRGMILREEGVVEMDRSQQAVIDVKRGRSIRRGESILISYESVNLWRFQPLLSLVS